MGKSVTGGDRGQGVRASAEDLIQVQLPLGMLATLEDVQQGFFSLCVALGREVLTAMMESEREALCGSKWVPNAERRAVRGGTMKSEVTLGGRRASLREGLEETLTLQRLGVAGALYRSLRSTNAIESLNGSVVPFCRNVHRWRDGSMLLRWIGAPLREAQKRFRRLKGFRDVKHLFAALDRRTESEGVELKKRVA